MRWSQLLLHVRSLLGVFFGRPEELRQLLQIAERHSPTAEALAPPVIKDDLTHSHVRRVQAYAMGLARALEIADEATLKALEVAALLHDTGKIAVPDHILNKPGSLTTSEFDQIKLHVDVGADIVSLVDFPYPVEPIVRCHHENWDGSGYPRGLAGEDIPIAARILSVADCFDALTSDRPYRRRMSDDAALDILRERRGNMYEPRVVDAFIASYRDISVTIDTPPQSERLARVIHSRYANNTLAAGPGAAVPVAPDDLLAFVSMARLAAGDITLGDVLALSSTLVRNLVPAATGAWYVVGASRTALVAMETFGAHGPLLRGKSVRMGEGLTGWVGANRRPIINSDAGLDLDGPLTETGAPIESCMGVPLVAGETLVAVLTLYAPGRDAFREDLSRLLQLIVPHVARAIAAAAAASAARGARVAADTRRAAARDLRLVATH